jgi:hypothetical protein
MATCILKKSNTSEQKAERTGSPNQNPSHSELWIAKPRGTTLVILSFINSLP